MHDDEPPRFRPFVTGRAEGGVGLGLAIVRRIARHHGGDAHAHPRPGGGTTLEVSLRGRAASVTNVADAE